MYRDHHHHHHHRHPPPPAEDSPQHTDYHQHGMMDQDHHRHHHDPRHPYQPQSGHAPPEFLYSTSSHHHPSALPPPYPPPPLPYPPPPFQYPPISSFPPPPPPPTYLSPYISDTTFPSPSFSASPLPYHHGFPSDSSSIRERSNSPLENLHSPSVFENYPPVLHHTPSSQDESSVTGFSRSASSNIQPCPREVSEMTLQEPPVYTHRQVDLPKGQLVRVFCKSNRSYNLCVRDHRLMMVKADTSNESQQWVRDGRFALRVKDSYGHPAFMLINKASKKVLRHAKGELQELQLVDYEPGMEDDDLLWTESQDFGEGFKTVRMASNTLLNMTVGSGTIKEGSPIILDTWHKKDNQLWKIFPL